MFKFTVSFGENFFAVGRHSFRVWFSNVRLVEWSFLSSERCLRTSSYAVAVSRLTTVAASFHRRFEDQEIRFGDFEGVETSFQRIAIARASKFREDKCVNRAAANKLCWQSSLLIVSAVKFTRIDQSTEHFSLSTDLVPQRSSQKCRWFDCNHLEILV